MQKADNIFHSRKDCKIIYSDIDGTLLQSDHHISPGTKTCILELEREGIPFILVSARMPGAVRLIRRELGNHSPIVCYSGGLILDQEGEVMHSCQMSLDLAIEMKGLLERDHPQICCNTYGMEKWIVDDDQNPWVMREEQITESKSKTGHIQEAFAKEGGIHKFLLMGEPESILAAECDLKTRYPSLTILKSNANYLEVMHGSVKKSAGVRILSRHYRISKDQAVAFGDGENDIDMLQAVRFGIAMENAPEIVRQQAAFVTRSNDEEGILAVLQQLQFLPE